MFFVRRFSLKFGNKFNEMIKNLTILIGVQWLGHQLLPGSRDVTKRLQELGKTVYLITNLPVKTRVEVHESAVNRGYELKLNEIIAVSHMTAKYLHDLKFDKKVYLIGAHGLSSELDNFGIRYIDSDVEGFGSKQINPFDVISNGIELDEEVGAVLIGFDWNFNYSKMLEASSYLKDPKCLFIATSFDEVYPTKNNAIVPAIGPVIRAIEVASGREATLIGKPNVNICKTFIENGTIKPERTLIIGDSAKYDILLGYNCGFQTLLVGSGINNYEEIQAWQNCNLPDQKKLIPDLYLPKLGDLLPYLLK